MPVQTSRECAVRGDPQSPGKEGAVHTTQSLFSGRSSRTLLLSVCKTQLIVLCRFVTVKVVGKALRAASELTAVVSGHTEGDGGGMHWMRSVEGGG